ncbi:hypothetical protein CKA32_000226 [Geitlerinema sp. FC II]|nr:hypothetical protein CKA32_000226 [Geitlerinema sp. FC II]
MLEPIWSADKARRPRQMWRSTLNRISLEPPEKARPKTPKMGAIGLAFLERFRC